MAGVPAWATLEVVTGGFATGNLLAGGPLLPHEKELLNRIPEIPPEGTERLSLNAFFLTDEGFSILQEWLKTGCYEVKIPEEGALLVVAWLTTQGHWDAARNLIEGLAPWFSTLRFYPAPAVQPQRSSSRVHLQDLGQTLADLRAVRPHPHVQAQKEAVEVWLPLYDRMVALFLETVEDGWPCRKYPTDWIERAQALLQAYVDAKEGRGRPGKTERRQGHAAQLRAFLAKCVHAPEELTGREVGRIRVILNTYLDKHGVPGSPEHAAARQGQGEEVSAPTFHSIAAAIAPRLEKQAQNEGLDDVTPLLEPVTEVEAEVSCVPSGTPVPTSLQRKVQRCLNESVAVLIDRGLITSGETLAKVLPQMTSGLRAVGILEPTLRHLYTFVYRAFRRRRSLLLLDLSKQVQIEELPWVSAMNRFRSESLSSRELARQTLEDVVVLSLASFPQAILPNKLLQELRALARGADLDLPIVDELAADIFMGEFSGKFLASAKVAASLLGNSLYATYYAIDFDEVMRLPDAAAPPKRVWFWSNPQMEPNPFPKLCASRAAVPLGTWNPATNGMIIEQQQILTTQNLAALFVHLKAADLLEGHLGDMARQCFGWICKRLQVRANGLHSQLVAVKNAAYAWRQMVFFLALRPPKEVQEFLLWAEAHLDRQETGFRIRFAPALKGLQLAARGQTVEEGCAMGVDVKRFLGWSSSKHWLIDGP